MASSSPLETIGYNEDIMTEITLFLPVKSILRFRSVSKQWHSLLTHHRFIQRYASHKATNSLLFFKHSSGRIESLHLKGSDNHNLDMADFGYIENSSQDIILSLASSCNGLLVFKSVFPSQSEFFVCNPSTRKYTKLDDPDSISKAQFVLFLAFDPSKSPYYKVVFFWKDGFFSDGYNITIYSSETKTCKKLGYTVSTDNMLFYSGAYLNGPILWARIPSKTAVISSIFYFDIDRESIREFPMPSYSSLPNDCIKYFGACRGHLHLIFCPPDSRAGHRNVFNVCELKEDHPSWFVKYKVDLDDIAIDMGKISKKFYQETSILCLLEDEEEYPTLILTLPNQIFSLPNRLLAYNLINKTTKTICDFPYQCRSIDWNWTFHCVESLFDV